MLTGEGAGVGTLKEGSGIGDCTWYEGDAGAEVDDHDETDAKRRGSRYWSSGVAVCRAPVATWARAARGESNKSCSPSELGDPKRWIKEWRMGESSRSLLTTAVVEEARDTNV